MFKKKGGGCRNDTRELGVDFFLGERGLGEVRGVFVVC